MQTWVTLRPPALRTSTWSAWPTWKFLAWPPEKIAWTRSAGDWADGDRGTDRGEGEEGAETGAQGKTHRGS